MSTVYQAYRNQHEHRNYPFADNATLRATNGVQLPSDFLVDALLYPIDLTNDLYVSSINFSDRQITLADSVTQAVHGIATWTDSDTTAYVYEDNVYARMVGILVLGAGRLDQSVGGTLSFTPATASFTPTAIYALNQPGVRGITLSTGGLFTGAIKLEGRNGVSVRTYIDDDGRHIVTFNITGIPEPLADCFECGLVRCIRIENPTGSYLIAAQCASNALCITTPFELSDVCPPSNISIPSERVDPCVTPTPCSEIAPTSSDEEFSICPTNGRLYILTPSTADYDNPLRADATEDPAPVPNYKGVVDALGLSQTEREKAITRQFDTTALTRGKLMLEYRGIGRENHA